jgi:autotransporter-associated beta strand protein
VKPTDSDSNLNPRICKPLWRVLIFHGTLLLGLCGMVHSAPPDLTAGGVPNSTWNINLGPTGMEGWAYIDGNGTADARQIKVNKVDAGSPADGILAVNDVILGVNGTGANPVPFTWDARIALAQAINQAEGRNPATLNLIRWRAGVTATVTITLEYMGGSYTATAPFNCPKSAAILEKGVNYVMSSEPGSGSGGFGTNVLMAVNDPTNPANAARQLRAQTEARALNLTQAQIDFRMSGGVERVFQSVWSRGPQLITQAEYYLQTGDSTVLPSIRARAIEIANGQSMFGTMGHNFALQQPDGQNNGPYAIGYGPVNNAGMPCFLGLVLANKCGLTDAPILAGIDRAAKFFQYYTDLGGIHYGESAEHLNLMSNNGKSGLAAIALGMINGYDTQAKYFTKQSVYGAVERDKGHTGPYFSHLWTPLGANLGGQAALTRYFQQNAVLYDLARRWNGAFVYQANGIEVYGTDHRASWTILLTYAAPLAKLHITGKNANPALALNSTEMAEVNQSMNYNPASRTMAQLLQDLAHPLPQVHTAAGNEIDLNRQAEHASILPTLTAMAQNGATFAEQHGALYTLAKIANDSTAPVLAGLLMSPDSKVRDMAARALDALSLTAKTNHVSAIVNSLVAYDRPILPLDPANPMHLEKARFGSLLFGANGVWGSGRLTTANRSQLYPAFRIIASAPMGPTRDLAFGVASNLTKTDVENLADVLVQVGLEPPLAGNNSLRGGKTSRTDAISVLQAKNIAEGVPMSAIAFLEMWTGQDTALGILKNYASSSLTVQPDPKVPDFCEVLVKSEPTFAADAQAVLNAIAADQLPDKLPKKLTSFKRIDWIVADKPLLNLPATSTVLRVQSSDLANGDPIYTWRKVHGIGNVSFTPNGTGAAKNTTVVFDGTPGVYLFEVKLSDSRGLTEVTKTVQVTLRGAGGTLPLNSPPTAGNQSLAADQGTPTQMILNAADPEGYPLNYTVTTAPEYGSLSGTAPNLVYTPAANYSGPDSITYQVQDSEGQMAGATVNITVNTAAPVGLAVYEPFDTPSVGNLTGTAGSGSIGFSGSWSTGVSITTEATSLNYGNVPVKGNKVRSVSTNSPGGSRRISTSALAGRGLLDDGATVWMSMMLQGTAYPETGRISIALANNGFTYDPNIPNDGSQPGSGLGVTVDEGVVYAAQYHAAAVGTPLLGNNDSAVAGTLNYHTPRLLVAKITWGATSDKIEVFMPWEDMLLPAPTSVLTANVNQAVFDTLTFSRGHNVFLDELRVGPTYQSVVQGTEAMTEDNAAPTPDPMGFAVAPAPSGASSITMTASTAHDQLEVEYYFECTGGAGGHDSGWQASPVYTDTGLTPGVPYSYRVKARDRIPGLNETAFSTAAAATIQPLGTVPNVVGFAQALAEDLVESAGLSLGSITTATAFSPYPAGHVVTQSPAAGTAAYGSPVNLVISIGQDPALPTLAPLNIVDNKHGGPVVINTPITYTLTFSEDIQAASLNATDFVNAGSASCTIGTITEISPGVVTVVATPTSTGFMRFAVAAGASILDAQGQAFNSTIETIDDTVITIQLPSVSVPNVVLLSQTIATSTINSANLLVGTVTSVHDAVVPAGKVISQSPAGGTFLLGQHVVDLVISLGPTPERIRPLIASISPTDNAADVNVSSNLVATFNEPILLGTGNVTVKNLTNGNSTTIPVSDASQVSVSNTVLTINPTALLLSESNYAIQIGSNAVKDLAGNNFAGITDNTTWNFRTADTNPPSPNPMRFAVQPTVVGETSITMTAATATDSSGVQYFFECTAGGGSSSGWQDSPTFTNTGLAPETQYSYRVRARDKSSAQTPTTWSAIFSVTTPVPDTTTPTPDPMSFAVLPGALGDTSITMTATTATDASGVQYFFECTAGGGNNSAWQDSRTFTATGLTANTPYSYRVRARDKSNAQNPTAWSADVSATTWATPRNLYSSGGRTWNNATANWGTVTAGPYDTATWGNGDTAVLEGTAGTVTLGEPISIRNLTFTHTTGTYTITGSALNFTSGTILASNPPNTSTVNAILRSNISGSPAINVAPMDGDEQFALNPVNTGSMIIGTVSGSGGSGSERLNLQGGAGSSGTIAAANGVKVIQSAGAWTLGSGFGYGHAISGGTLTLNGNLNATSRSLTLSGTGVINYNAANAVSATAANATANTDNGFRLQTGASIDQTSGAAINTSTSNPSMTWEGNWTFIGTNGGLSNLNLGSGNVFLKAANPQVTVSNAATTLTVGGVIANDATLGRGLTKVGLGTLILSGANTYTGATTLSAGKLVINGNQGSASGNVSVATGTTLGGTGTLGGNTTIANNGRLEFNLITSADSHDKLELAAGKTLTFSGASVLTINGTTGASPGTYTLLTAPGGITGDVPATVNLPADWVATVSIVGNDLVLDVTTVDSTTPTLVGIVDDRGGNTIDGNTLINYTVTFSEDINAASVSAADFGNAGTSAVNFGAITETSPGVFAVAVTPTTAGTLQLQVNAGAIINDAVGIELNTASAIPDNTIINVNPPNVPPAWSSSPVNEMTATEETVYSSTLADNATDSNGNTLAFSKLSGPEWLSVAIDGTLSGTPSNSDVGLNSFTVSVSDGLTPEVPVTLNISVTNTNDVPVFAANPIVRTNAAQNLAYTGTLAGSASDVDADTVLSYAKVSGPAWLSIASNGAFSGTPTNSDLGLNAFTVSVSDGIAPAVEATLNITVVVSRTLYSSGGKAWNTSTTDWGTVTAGPYNTAAWSGGDSAILEGTAGTLTLGEAILIKNLTINTPLYVVKGHTLNFTSGTIVTPNPPNTNAPGATIESNITGAPTVNASALTTNEYFTFKPAANGGVVLGTITGAGGSGAGIISFQGGAGSNSTVASVNGPKSYFEGSGTWTLTGLASSYGNEIKSGNVIVSTGTIQANSRSTSLTGGTLHYNNPGAVRDNTPATGIDNDFRLRGGSIDNTSGAAITTSTWNPNMTMEANWTFIGANGAASNLFLGNGGVILTATPQITVQNAAATLSLGGVISGTGFGLTKAGAGTLELRGANTYTGTTTVAGGTLKLGANNVIPNASNVTIGTGTLDVDTRADTMGTLDVNGDAVINLGSGASLSFADSKAVGWVGTLNITGTLGATSLRFGDSADDLTSGAGGQLSRISVNGSGLGRYILDANGYLVLDSTPPTLTGTSIVDNQSGSAILENTTVTYTVTFSEDIDAATVSTADFGNAGTSTVDFGSITEISPGVFIVVATPTNPGTLRLQVNDGAEITDVPGNLLDTSSAILDDTTITVNPFNPYAAWAAGGAVFDADTNIDGVENGMAWLLGAASPSENSLNRLPIATRSANNLRLTFRCLKSTKRGGAVLKVQSSSDLGLTDPWTNHEVEVPDQDSIVNGVIFDTTDDGDYINVIADIPADGGKRYGRLIGVLVP